MADTIESLRARLDEMQRDHERCDGLIASLFDGERAAVRRAEKAEMALESIRAEREELLEAIRVRDLNDNGLFMEAFKHKIRADAAEMRISKLEKTLELIHDCAVNRLKDGSHSGVAPTPTEIYAGALLFIRDEALGAIASTSGAADPQDKTKGGN